MRNSPLASVTTICSPCSAGEVAVTTTSASGLLLEASTTLPVRVPEPICACAGRGPESTTGSAAAESSALTTNRERRTTAQEAEGVPVTSHPYQAFESKSFPENTFSYTPAFFLRAALLPADTQKLRSAGRLRWLARQSKVRPFTPARAK